MAKMATVFVFPAVFFSPQKVNRPQEGDPQMRGGIAELRPGHTPRRGFLDENSKDLTDLIGFLGRGR